MFKSELFYTVLHSVEVARNRVDEVDRGKMALETVPRSSDIHGRITFRRDGRK